MDALVAFGDDGAHAEQAGALRRPVAGGAGAVLLARQDHERYAFVAVLHGRVVDALLLAVGQMAGDATLGAGRELVAEADVRERAPHHHLVVPAPGAVGVEVLATDVAVEEVGGGGAVRGDAARRRDVVGRHGVADHHEDARARDVLELARLLGQVLEVGRVLHVGGAVVPAVAAALGGFERAPGGVALEHRAVLVAEHLGAHGVAHGPLDRVLGGPEVGEHDGVAVAVLADGLGQGVEVHVAGERVGHDERRRGKVVGAHDRIHAALEVAVPREHGRRHEAALVDRRRHVGVHRPRVADAGGAAVADEVEAELVEVGGQAGGVEVVGDDLRPRREARLDPRLALQAALDGRLREQAGADQDLGVGRVRAARDGRDHDRPVPDLERGAVPGDFDRGRVRGVAGEVGERPLPGLLRFAQEDTVLGPARPRQRRLDLAHVELEHGREAGVGRVVGAEEALLLAVRLDERDLLLVTAGEAQVAQRLLVDGKETDGRPVLGGHVRDGRARGEGELREPRPEELDELPDDPQLAQHLRDREDEVRARRALRQGSRQAEADDLGDEHGDGLAEHGRLCLDAPHAPAEHAEPVDHRRVRVRAHERVRVDEPCVLVLEDDAREVLEVDLVDDARARRHHAEVAEGLLAPAQEEVALAVAFVLEAHVLGESPVGTVGIDLHGVVDDEVDGLEGVDALGVAAERLQRLAHGSEVDDGGHAGEVLQEDARGREGDLALLAGVGAPVRQRLDVLARDGVAVLAAQQVLEQHPLGERQAGRALAREDRVEPVEGDGAPSHGQRVAAVEAVEHGGSPPPVPFTRCCPGPVGPWTGAFGTKRRQYSATRAPEPRRADRGGAAAPILPGGACSSAVRAPGS